MTITPPTVQEHESAFQLSSQRSAEPAPGSVTPPTPSAGAPGTAESAPPEPAPTEPVTHTVVAGQPDAATVRTVWSEVRAAVRERSRTTEVMLSSATVRRLDGDTLVLSHDSAPLAKRLTESRNAGVVCAALRDVLGVDWAVVCESGSEQTEMPTTAAPGAPAPVHQYTRASGSGAHAPSQPADDVPLPDGPSDPDDPQPGSESGPPPAEPVDQEAMLAEAASSGRGDPGSRRDPEELALELLAAELGAKPLDSR